MVKLAKELSDKFDSEYLDKSVDNMEEVNRLADQIVTGLLNSMVDRGNKYVTYPMGVARYNECIINTTIKLLRASGYHVEYDEGILYTSIKKSFIREYWILLLIPVSVLLLVLSAIFL